MAHDDLVSKIIDLQAQVATQLAPAYVKAKAHLDSLQKELDDLNHYFDQQKAAGKSVTLDAVNRHAALSNTAIPAAQAALPAATSNPNASATVDELMKRLETRLSGMAPATAAAYGQKTAAMQADPSAAGDWADFVGSLRRSPAKNPDARLRADVRAARAAGTPMTPGQFASARDKYSQGEMVDPDNDPEVQAALAHAGRNTLQRTFNWRNAKAHWTSGEGYGVAIDALNLGAHAATVSAQMDNGQRYTQEARQRAGYGFIPGIMGAIGVGVGAFGGPGGAMAGGGIMTAAGTAIEGYLSAGSEQHEALRLAGENLARNLGLAGAAGQRFSDTLRSAADKMGTPAAELANSVVALDRAGNAMTPAAITQESVLQKALGDLYPQSVAPRAALEQSPYGYVFRSLAAQGKIGPGDYRSLAAAAALGGNESSALSFLQTSTPPDEEARERSQAEAPKTAFGKWLGDILWKVTGRKGTLAGAEAGRDAHIAAYNKGRANDRAGLDDDITTYLRSENDQQTYGALASSASTAGRMVLTRGGTASELAPLVAQQIANLKLERDPLAARFHQISAQLATASPAARPWLMNSLAQTKAQMMDLDAQAQGAQAGLFGVGVSQRSAALEGTLSRLGLTGTRLTLGGLSSFDPSVVGNYASREGQLGAQSRYYAGLAADKSNPLGPEERQQARTEAAQARTQAMALRNDLAVRRIGDTETGSASRQSALRLGITGADVADGVLASLSAQNRLLQEQGRLHDELTARLRDGNLTYEQRQGLVQKITDLEASNLTGRKQAFDTALSGLEGRYGAAASGGYAQAGYGAAVRGTSSATAAQVMASYTQDLSRVASLRLAAAAETNPDRQIERYGAYQSAAAEVGSHVVDALSDVSMSPELRASLAMTSGRMARQMISPFESGSVATSNLQLGRLIGRERSAVSAQMKTVASNPNLTADQKSAITANLTQRDEDLHTQQAVAQNDANYGWLDRLTSMAVNSPSFASRLMPSFADASKMAEVRGLGPQSARIWGYYDRSSYEGSRDQGYNISDLNKFSFGLLPRDRPGTPLGMGSFADGTGTTLDSVQTGVLGTGMASGESAALLSVLGEIKNFLGHLASQGLKVSGDLKNPTTGQVAASVTNAHNNYSSTSIQRGGAGR